MANVLVNDSSLSAIGAAIRAKNGSSDTYKPGDMAAAIAAIPTGGGSVSDIPERDVNYYDWDGTLLHSYTAAEFAQLTEHPANPTHTGLTSQGWNWTLADAKTYVAKYGFLDIGNFVVSADGKTHIKVFANGDADHDTVSFNRADTPSLLVDWGDGTTETITASSASHAYAAAGEYEAVVTHGNSTGSLPYMINGGAVRQIVWGDSVPSTGLQPWSNCNELQYAAIPKGAPWSFYSAPAPALRALVLNGNNFYTGNFNSLVTLCTGYDPDRNFSISGVGGAKMFALRRIALPNNTQRGSSNTTAFFKDNKVLERAATDVFMANMFYACERLESIVFGVGSYSTIENYMCQGCTRLKKIVLPDGITTIGNSAFSGCYNTKYVSLPSTLTNIGPSGLALGSYSYKAKNVEIHFKATTPPVVAASNAFNYIEGATCTIYVPRGYLTAYTTATNYPDPNTFTYVEED